MTIHRTEGVYTPEHLFCLYSTLVGSFILVCTSVYETSSYYTVFHCSQPKTLCKTWPPNLSRKDFSSVNLTPDFPLPPSVNLSPSFSLTDSVTLTLDILGTILSPFVQVFNFLYFIQWKIRFTNFKGLRSLLLDILSRLYFTEYMNKTLITMDYK